MNRPAIRRTILEAIARRAPAPTRLADLARDPDVVFLRMSEPQLAAECAELEDRAYLENLKNRARPVWNGITGAARDQLDMSGQLDPALWGDAAL
ncbi:MAG: hypothetical protein KAI66_20935 [Lentisphaeria bacterium]|nr:hypothetical protein [Lentisphaeria bacterium]